MKVIGISSASSCSFSSTGHLSFVPSGLSHSFVTLTFVTGGSTVTVLDQDSYLWLLFASIVYLASFGIPEWSTPLASGTAYSRLSTRPLLLMAALFSSNVLRLFTTVSSIAASKVTCSQWPRRLLEFAIVIARLLPSIATVVSVVTTFSGVFPTVADTVPPAVWSGSVVPISWITTSAAVETNFRPGTRSSVITVFTASSVTYAMMS